jgi:hypothetical protein
MTVWAIPFEQGRFYVQSRSRADVVHVVDLAYVEDGKRKTAAACGCESYQCHGRMCPHILATVKHEQERLKIWK